MLAAELKPPVTSDWPVEALTFGVLDAIAAIAAPPAAAPAIFSRLRREPPSVGSPSGTADTASSMVVPPVRAADPSGQQTRDPNCSQLD